MHPVTLLQHIQDSKGYIRTETDRHARNNWYHTNCFGCRYHQSTYIRRYISVAKCTYPTHWRRFYNHWFDCSKFFLYFRHYSSSSHCPFHRIANPYSSSKPERCCHFCWMVQHHKPLYRSPPHWSIQFSYEYLSLYFGKCHFWVFP